MWTLHARNRSCVGDLGRGTPTTHSHCFLMQAAARTSTALSLVSTSAPVLSADMDPITGRPAVANNIPSRSGRFAAFCCPAPHTHTHTRTHKYMRCDRPARRLAILCVRVFSKRWCPGMLLYPCHSLCVCVCVCGRGREVGRKVPSLRICKYIYGHKHTHTYTHTHIHAYTHTHIHTYTHTHTHIHTHTHTDGIQHAACSIQHAAHRTKHTAYTQHTTHTHTRTTNENAHAMITFFCIGLRLTREALSCGVIRSFN